MKYLSNFLEVLSNIPKTFLGAWGLTVEQGLTEGNLQEVELKQVIIERCQEVIGVVDSSKFGQVALSTFAPVEKLSRIVTDAGAGGRVSSPRH